MKRHTRREAFSGRDRGSALILALVVILVLTVIGIGVAYMSSTEDKVSGNVQLQKEGFYAAETGLRAAESVLSSGVLSNTVNVTNLLNPALPTTVGLSPNTFTPPGGGYAATLLMTGSTSYRDVAVPMPAGSRDVVSYTLYVRNDKEDPSGSNTTDTNQTLNVISVGFVTLPNGKRAVTKILEEQIIAKNVGVEGGSQKGGNAGGTNG